ncbi:class I SAM-dependent methyltransferase [Haloimpatiens sp. FM7315]|uniref:class I SAM-dependent methyltransferase n=1 Tax=Haloimpatiens sp. FM7315 TaxID=3298609 RepID=UPI0035A350FD
MFKEHNYVAWGDICSCGSEVYVLQNKYHPWEDVDFKIKIKCRNCGKSLEVDKSKAENFYNRKILSYFKDVEGTVIDLGCGSGFLSEYLLENNNVKKIYAIDNDIESKKFIDELNLANRLNCANELNCRDISNCEDKSDFDSRLDWKNKSNLSDRCNFADKLHLRDKSNNKDKITFLHMDICDLGKCFENKKVDYIVSRDVFMFVDDTERYFQDVNKVVSKGVRQMGWYIGENKRMRNKLTPEEIKEKLINRDWKVYLEDLDWYKSGYFIRADKMQ